MTGEAAADIDGQSTFVICSSGSFWEDEMTGISKKALLTMAALVALCGSAFAQGSAATPWELKPDMGYGYDKDGKTFAYKMGTNNAGNLLKGARKVPKGTLFFIGQNGQLYMRTGPYLEGDGRFKFGAE